MPHALFLGSSLATLDRVSNPVAAAAMPLQEQKRTYTFWQQFGRARRALFWVHRSPEPSIMQNAGALARPTASLHELTEVAQPTARHSASPIPADVCLAETKEVPQIQTQPEGYHGHQNNSLEFVRAHLGHAIIDIGRLFWCFSLDCR